MLTYDDYNFLLEALETKSREATSAGFTNGLLGMIFAKDQEEAKGQLDHVMEEAKEKDNLISERIVLLKAKLITLRDKSMISEINPNSDSFDQV